MKGSRWQLWAMVLALGLVAGCKKKETEAERKEREAEAQQKAEHDARLVSRHFGKVLYVTADAEEPDEDAETKSEAPRCDSWANACTLKQAFMMIGGHKEGMGPKPKQSHEDAASPEGAEGQTAATPAGPEEKMDHGKGGPKKGGDKGKIYIALAGGDYDVKEELRVNFNILHHVKMLVIRGGWKKDAELLLPEKKKADSEESDTSTEGEGDEDSKTMLKAGSLQGRDSLLALDMGGATTRTTVRVENLEITGSMGQRAVLDAKVGSSAKLILDGVNVHDNKREAKVITRKVARQGAAGTFDTKVEKVFSGAIVEIQSVGEVHFVDSMFEKNESQNYGAVRVGGLKLLSNNAGNLVGGKLYVKGCLFKDNKADRIVVSEKVEGTTSFNPDGVYVDIVLKDKEAWILPKGAGALHVSESRLWLQKNMDKETEFNSNVAVGALYKDQVDTTKSYVKMGYAPAVYVSADAQLRKLEAKFSSNNQELPGLKVVTTDNAALAANGDNFSHWDNADDNGSESRDGVYAADMKPENVANTALVGNGGAAGDNRDAAITSGFVMVGDDLSSAYMSSL